MAELFSAMRAQADAGVGSELFLFYSGHGDVDHGEGYVLLEDRRLTRGDLYALLARSPAARNHVFIDACKSYFLAFERGPGGRRTPYAGSFVAPSEPGRLDNVGLVLSTSSDRDLNTADLTASWNILDFWVSYFNAKQQADKVLVAEEQRRRVMQTLFQDVRRAFWRALSAQRLSGDIRETIREAQNALESSRKSEQLRSPIDALR